MSYLNVTRAPEDEPDGVDTDNASLVASGRVALQRILDSGAFTELDEPCMYLYRLIDGDHEQTAIVADVSVAAYEAGEIRVHEQIRGARAELLADHLEGVGHSSSPIALAFEADAAALAALESAKDAADPILDFEADDGLRQTVWRLDDADLIGFFVSVLAAVPAYVIDGHHRAAAALGVRHRANVSSSDDASPSDFMLGALFPLAQLRMGSFNRWVRDVDGEALDRVMLELHDRYAMVDVEAAFEPKPGELGVCVRGRWHKLDLGTARDATDARERLANLDPVVLQRDILQAMLGILDAGSDARLVNLSWDVPLESLEARVVRDGGIAFAVAPLTMGDLTIVADGGLTMPPKSTYFTPKARSGVFLRPL